MYICIYVYMYIYVLVVFLYRWANAFWIFDFFTFLKCPIPQMLLNFMIFVFFVNNCLSLGRYSPAQNA